MRTNHILAIIAVTGGICAAFTHHSEHNGLYPDWAHRTERVRGEKIRYISASYLSDMIYSKEADLVIYDTREPVEFENYHIPRAELYEEGTGHDEGAGSGIIVLYGADPGNTPGESAADLPGRVYVLKGGLEAWYSQVLFPDFTEYRVRNRDQLDYILRRCRFFGGEPRNSQVLNIESRENRYREGC